MEAAKTAIVAAAVTPATVFMALELSRSTWLAALHSPVADKAGQYRFDGGDSDGLLALIARKRGQAEERSERSVRVSCGFEAGCDGVWLHRWLCAHAVENRALDAASVLVDRRGGSAARRESDRGVPQQPAPPQGRPLSHRHNGHAP